MTYTSIANDIALHEKCIKILTMIHNAKNRYSTTYKFWEEWEKADGISIIRLVHPNNPVIDLDNYRYLITRLESYYTNTINSHSHAA